MTIIFKFLKFFSDSKIEGEFVNKDFPITFWIYFLLHAGSIARALAVKMEISFAMSFEELIVWFV